MTTQTIFTVATGVEIHLHTKRSQHLTKVLFKRQIQLFKLLALMEVALTATLSKLSYGYVVQVQFSTEIFFGDALPSSNQEIL